VVFSKTGEKTLILEGLYTRYQFRNKKGIEKVIFGVHLYKNVLLPPNMEGDFLFFKILE